MPSDIRSGSVPISALLVNDQAPKPIPSDSQALVKIKAFGLDHRDSMCQKRDDDAATQATPLHGIEFSGTVEELGHGDICGCKVGDEVFGLAYGGGYAEYLVISTRLLICKPKELRWELAAAIPATWMMTIQALYLVGCLSAGDNVLFHVGTSSLSIAGIQLARAAGAGSIFVTAGSDDMVRFCEQKLGATKGFNYRIADWVRGIQDATNGIGANVIIDSIGGDYVQRNFEAASQDARIVQVASMSGSIISNLDISQLESKCLRWEGIRPRDNDIEYQAQLRDILVERVLPKFLDGSFQAQIDKIVNWSDVQATQTWMASNVSKGKIICVIE
jgi:NADPH:quinone reductase-like Zn-dependent oxidoreductase